MFNRLAAFAALAVPALCYSIPSVAHLQRRAEGLTVELSQLSGTQVSAKLTNAGSETLQLLNYGSLFDDDKVQKLDVYQDDSPVKFTGIQKTYQTSDLPTSAFTTLAPGESFETKIDVADLHEVSDGEYTIDTAGAIPFANADVDSTDLVGAAPYSSNSVTIKLSGVKPRSAFPEIANEKRTAIKSGCTGTVGTNTRTALTNAVSLSNAAANAATGGSTTTFNTYFKTTASGTRSQVANNFRTVATEAGSTTSGRLSFYCQTDVYSGCSSNVLAYTVPSQSVVVICPLSYQVLPVLTKTCHAQDLTTTIIHEFTHGLLGTLDNAYGFSASTALSASRALNNADTYALYSNAVYVPC